MSYALSPALDFSITVGISIDLTSFLELACGSNELCECVVIFIFIRLDEKRKRLRSEHYYVNLWQFWTNEFIRSSTLYRGSIIDLKDDIYNLKEEYRGEVYKILASINYKTTTFGENRKIIEDALNKAGYFDKWIYGLWPEIVSCLFLIIGLLFIFISN